MTTQTQTDLPALRTEQLNTLEKFTNKETVDYILEAHEIELRGFVPDASTAKGRKEIASFAYKFRQSKSAMEKVAKAVKAEAKETVDKVNAESKRMREEFDRMAEEARKPLDEWEAKEKERTDRLEGLVNRLKSYRDNLLTDLPSMIIRDRLEEAKAFPVDDSFGEYKEEALQVKIEAIQNLEKKLEDKIKQEKEAAELERLRKEDEERKAKEKAEAEEKERQAERERIAKEAAEKAEREKAEAEAEAKRLAEENERLRVDTIRSKIDRVIHIGSMCNIDSAECERRLDLLSDYDPTTEGFEEFLEEAVKELYKARKNLDEMKEKAIKFEANEKAELEEKAAKAERERIQREQAERERKQKEAEEKRLADQNHKDEINRTAISCIEVVLSEMGVEANTEDAAEQIVNAIAKSRIPHVTINY